jgi:hypothetical protein
MVGKSHVISNFIICAVHEILLRSSKIAIQIIQMCKIHREMRNRTACKVGMRIEVFTAVGV